MFKKNTRLTGVKNHGGDDGTRTRDLLHAKQALSQLSYNPTNTSILHKIQ